VFAEPELKHLVSGGMEVIEFGSSGPGGFETFVDSGPFHAFEPIADSVAIQCYT
jgi:hypothetical protein